VPRAVLDVTDEAAVERTLLETAPDVVYHFAAILSSGGERDPQACWRVNMGGTYAVLEACRRAQSSTIPTSAPRVVFASTIAAFGPGLPDPVPNEVPMRPTTMYGVTKVAGELLGEYYFAKYGLDFRAIRFPGLVNAGRPGAGTSDYALFMYVDGIRDGRYEAFCHEDTRIPFMYMPDAIRAVVELSLAERSRLRRCTYNVAAMSPRAGEIAESVRRAVPGVKLTFRSVDWRQKILDSWPRALDDAAAREEWGWRPEFDLDGMTRDLVPKVRDLVERGRI
jgi:threonine 3-dehydrogenase